LAALYVKDPKMIAGQYTDAIDFHAKTHGLFRPDAKRTPATLAGEVRELHRRAPNCGRTHPINATARRNDLSEYVVKAAIYGE
jgi:hypothetical protein